MEPDVSRLPAQAVPESALGSKVSDPQVGDVVVVYSRGANRMAQVTKVGPKRVEVVYTTKGAWDQAQKIYENYMTPGYVEQQASYAAKSAAKNYDFSVRQSNRETALYNPSDEEVARAKARV